VLFASSAFVVDIGESVAVEPFIMSVTYPVDASYTAPCAAPRQRAAARQTPANRPSNILLLVIVQFLLESIAGILPFLCRTVQSLFSTLDRAGAHLRFSPMRFEIGNNQNNW
jgi:hypothetical protein